MEKSHVIIGVGVLAILGLYMSLKSKYTITNSAPQIIPPSNVIVDVKDSFVSKTPAQILNGGANTFNSTNNVTINQDSARWLSQQYMPIFGLVGVAR